MRTNETMAQFIGYAPEEHLGRTVLEVVPDLEPLARSLMNQIVETGKPVGPFEVAGETQIGVPKGFGWDSGLLSSMNKDTSVAPALPRLK